jgi:hypothetical protein
MPLSGTLSAVERQLRKGASLFDRWKQLPAAVNQAEALGKGKRSCLRKRCSE